MADDFASLMESMDSTAEGGARQLERGEIVEGTVIQISADSVFLSVGARTDARVERLELTDKNGTVRVKVGDTLRATVVDPEADGGPLLSASMGRGSVDASALQAALDGGIPVEATVTKAVKAGLEVNIGGARAFCPASQVDRNYTEELDGFVGQTLQVLIIEVRDDGRSVVVSRRALLDREMAERAREMKETLVAGTDIEGTVHSIQKFGAIVDIGGVEGMIHISELAPRRVERVEDVVQVGEKVTVRVLGVEDGKRGLRVRLSLKALAQGGQPAQQKRDTVVSATVTKLTSFGVMVETASGEGLVPTRELDLPPGSDHRRTYPVGKQFDVVLLSRDPKSGKQRFSMKGVAQVRERSNYREYSKGPKGGGLGSLGDLLAKKLGIEQPAARPPAAANSRADTVDRAQQPAPATSRTGSQAQHGPPRSQKTAKTAEKAMEQRGVVKRKR